MNQLERNMEKYAELAIRCGLNVQQGQTVMINAPIAAVELVRHTVRKAYEAGAKNVYVEWGDDDITRIRYMHAPDESFTEYPMWKIKGLEELVANGAAFLSIYGPNPDLLQGVDPVRIATANKTEAIARAGYLAELMADKACWSVIAYPSEAWAKKVFPDAQTDEAVQKLWDAIFAATRVNHEDPIREWKAHVGRLSTAAAFLNRKQYRQLVYNGPGTRLTVDLPDKHLWKAGESTSMAGAGTVFSPNLPTEEVFTMPHKNGVNGTVRSTKPLNYKGNVIDNFSLTFEQGKVTQFTAETGYETLKHLLETDEGASRLGEVALVPYHSPISLTNVVFYNTLFDENASSHFAVGKAYPVNLSGGEVMSAEQLALNGANQSLVHVDFMIGSAEMNIDGVTKDGAFEPLFRNGNWAEQVIL